jgi:uncharacterized membrane protein (UPF0127 family)
MLCCPRPSRLISVIALLASAAAAQAQTGSVIFERADIRIDPVAVAAAKIPSGDPNVPIAPQPARNPVSYNIEVRSEDALQLEYIHTLNTLTGTTGVAITFNAPSLVALPHMQVFTPVDVLFVAEDGTILQIYPNLTLAELHSNVMASDPIQAFVFLKAGQVAAHHIMPRDIIAGSMFFPPPPVME